MSKYDAAGIPAIHLRRRLLPVYVSADHLSLTGQSAVYDIITMKKLMMSEV